MWEGRLRGGGWEGERLRGKRRRALPRYPRPPPLPLVHLVHLRSPGSVGPSGATRLINRWLSTLVTSAVSYFQFNKRKFDFGKRL